MRQDAAASVFGLSLAWSALPPFWRSVGTLVSPKTR